ncbi:polysaccharide lyase [Bisporella sp. PMI_857]|nr:polysaccharide lyase [Bisporella sp. PMI_857]
MFISILAAVVLLCISSVQATQTFSNTGTKAGWDYIHEEHNGHVDAVTNVIYEGSSALKMTQIYDPGYSGRYHSEVHHNGAYRRGDTGFYGFAFRLQENWQFSPAQSYNIAQFIADFSGGSCDEDYMPTAMISITGNQLVTRRKYGNVCPKSAQRTEYYNNIATVTAGVWHRIVIQASWKSDATGFYKVWYDGVKVLEKFNVETTVTDDRAFQFRVGLYANGWFDDGGLRGDQGTRSVWFDEIATGTTFADADPAQW